MEVENTLKRKKVVYKVTFITLEVSPQELKKKKKKLGRDNLLTPKVVQGRLAT